MVPKKQHYYLSVPRELVREIQFQHALQIRELGTLPLGTAAGAKVLRHRLHVWLLRLSTCILFGTCIVQLIALVQLWHPYLLPPCRENTTEFNDFLYLKDSSTSRYAASQFSSPTKSNPSNFSHVVGHHPVPRVYRSNGYLLISCNGGLNQMRAAICDMVAIASHLNLTLVVPELDKTSFWADRSDFGDIFDTDHFIQSLRDEVRIIRELPLKFHQRRVAGMIMSLPPVSWSNETYYLNQILPLLKKEKVLHFNKTDTRLANNGLPLQMQKLRCRVNYEALRFIPRIEQLGRKIVQFLKKKGDFVVLHLRYEMDMLAFSGCNHGCTPAEADELTKMRYAFPWWKEKIIDSVQKRRDGLCPLTPEETTIVLQALGFGNNTQIYIAAGEIYGSERRMAPLRAAYPNLVRKEMILTEEDLKTVRNHSSQMAALDYLVAIESDVFIPTYDGNMAKVVEGHRRQLGYRKTVLLDRRRLVELLDEYQKGELTWESFSDAVRQHHDDNHTGSPKRRNVIPDRPKEEDYFYANPEECLV